MRAFKWHCEDSNLSCIISEQLLPSLPPLILRNLSKEQILLLLSVMQLMASHSDSFFFFFPPCHGFGVPFVSSWEGQAILFWLQNHVQVSLNTSYMFGWHMESMFMVYLDTVTFGILFLSVVIRSIILSQVSVDFREKKKLLFHRAFGLENFKASMPRISDMASCSCNRVARIFFQEIHCQTGEFLPVTVCKKAVILNSSQQLLVSSHTKRYWARREIDGAAILVFA